jgi:hypothetical protein
MTNPPDPAVTNESTPSPICPTQNAFQRYFNTRAWKDLLFLSFLFAGGYYVRHHYFITNHDKWLVRPRLSVAYTDPKSLPRGRSGMFPCFFFSQDKRASEPVTIDDCATLLPDGKQWNTVEVNPAGEAFPLKTDLFVPDVIPLAFTRTYVPIGEWERHFHIYLPNVYTPELTGSRYPFTYQDFDLPDGMGAHYQRISPGTDYWDALFQARYPSSLLNGSRTAWNGWGWDIVLTNGLTLLSPAAYYAQRPQQASIVAIFDSQGREARLRRELNGDLTDITSPNGRTIHLTYQDGEIISGQSSTGDSVTYAYNPDHTISTVSYSGGSVIHYSYDSSLRLRTIESPPGTPTFKIDYDSKGRSAQVSTPSRSYRFEYHSEHATDDPGYLIFREHGKPAMKMSLQHHGAGIWSEVTPLSANDQR